MVTDNIIVTFMSTDKMLADDLTKRTGGGKLLSLIIDNTVKLIEEKVKDARFKNPAMPFDE